VSSDHGFGEGNGLGNREPNSSIPPRKKKKKTQQKKKNTKNAPGGAFHDWARPSESMALLGAATGGDRALEMPANKLHHQSDLGREGTRANAMSRTRVNGLGRRIGLFSAFIPGGYQIGGAAYRKT